MTYPHTPSESIRFHASHPSAAPGMKAHRSPDRNGIVKKMTAIIPAMIAATLMSQFRNSMPSPSSGAHHGTA